jgi:hypothetical protein
MEQICFSAETDGAFGRCQEGGAENPTPLLGFGRSLTAQTPPQTPPQPHPNLGQTSPQGFEKYSISDAATERKICLYGGPTERKNMLLRNEKIRRYGTKKYARRTKNMLVRR